MIVRHPICIRMNDGQYAEDGDIVECVKTKVQYNVTGEFMMRKTGNDSQMFILLGSRKRYFAANEICYIDDITGETIYITQGMRDNEMVENSIEVSLGAFLNQYAISQKWTSSDDYRLSAHEDEIVEKLIERYHNKERMMPYYKWMSIYSKEAISKETFNDAN